MEQLNESLQLAHNSTNPDTKVSRLEFAKSKLIELRAIANQHPKMSLTNEGAVLETINRLQEEFAAAGYYGQADISRSAYSPQPMVLNTDPEIVKGWRFSATIQLRTPLRILQMHGVMRDVADGPPERVEMHEGTWTPITKSFGEMGINLPELEIERQCASDIGPVPHDGGRYIGFLKSVRKIVETGESIAIRRANLKSELSKIEWRDFVSRHGGIECVCSRFFPSFLESIPKLTSDSIQSIRTLGLTTPAKLKGESHRVWWRLVC